MRKEGSKNKSNIEKLKQFVKTYESFAKSSNTRPSDNTRKSLTAK